MAKLQVWTEKGTAQTSFFAPRIQDQEPCRVNQSMKFIFFRNSVHGVVLDILSR